MKRILNKCLLLPLLVTILLGICNSQDNIPAKLDEFANSKRACDSDSFIVFAKEAERYRNDRRLSAEQFVQMAKESGTIILDARGKEAHQLLRIKGSVNLPYTSFSIENLKQIIPSTKTRVLIYCRNNIQTPPKDKAGSGKSGHPYPIDLGFDLDIKARSFGLNIPTFITLYGYGYDNVWELDPVVDPNDSVIEFESSGSPKADPTADANLGWDHPDDGEPPSGTVRADANGEAIIPISRMGLMTIRLTHMTRPNAIDYEKSFWTTLTFRVPEAENEAISSHQKTAQFEVQKLAVNYLPNAIQIHPKVISGGQPDGELAFRELKQLGVKTVISVDAARPDLVLAKRYGLRYVHLPHGYDGIPVSRVKELAKAVLALDGPIYIHCHHGKHRSPAAATAACITAGLIEPSASKAILKLAGTSENYIGLFSTVADASKSDLEELYAIHADFPESAKLTPMVEAMVAIEHTHDHLKQISAAGWRVLPKNPDIEAAHEALLLTEHFIEMLRLPIVAEQPGGFVMLLRESEIKSKELLASIRAWNESGNPKPVPRIIVEPFERLSANCVSCHRAFRDLASPIPSTSEQLPPRNGE